MTLGNIIKKYRDENNISMADFAKLSHISKPYVSMLEKDKNPKNGKPIVPSVTTLKNVANAMCISFDTLIKILDENQEILLETENKQTFSHKSVRIPVLGKVIAGIPSEAIADIIDYEEIGPDLAKTGEFFALQVHGASMEPKIYEGDIIIVKRQSSVESGETAVVMVNGDSATVKQVKIRKDGIILIGYNVAVYEPHFYSNKEIEESPVQILGKVIELRRKL